MSVWKGGLWQSQRGKSGASSRQFMIFDRADDYVEINAAAASVSNRQQLTVEAMVWIDDVYDDGVADASLRGEIFFAGILSGDASPAIQLRQNSNDDTYIFGYEYEAGGNFNIAWSGEGAPVVSTKQRWLHIAGVLDDIAGIMSLYHAGQLVVESPSSGPTATLDAAAIGARHTISDRFFSGRIARVSLWAAALSEAEIADLAANAPDAADPRLLHYWELDAGEGVVPDLVGNADGTVTGGPDWELSGIPGYR